MARGTHQYAFDDSNEVIAIRWNDNAIVTVLSNYAGHLPIHQVKRFDRKAKKMVNINQPHAIYSYNHTMGGVDLFDNAMNNYRITVRGKKWYWPLITNMIDAALVNAWKLHCLCRRFEKKDVMSQLDFKAFTVQCLMQSPHISQIPATPSVGKITKKSAANALRYDRVDHLIIDGARHPNKTLKRPRCKQCSSNTTKKCSKCNVPLHPKCFQQYHTTPNLP